MFAEKCSRFFLSLGHPQLSVLRNIGKGSLIKTKKSSSPTEILINMLLKYNKVFCVRPCHYIRDAKCGKPLNNGKNSKRLKLQLMASKDRLAVLH